MSDLPNDPIVIGYGAVRWGVECETVAMNVKPVLDGAGRTVKWLQYDFTLRFIVGQENQDVGMTTDLTLAQLRAELTRVGLELHYLRVGYGHLASAPGGVTSFGLPTNARDVCWGPRPQLLSYKPMGGQAAECVWSCTVCLATCPEDALYDQGVIEYVWKVGYSIDASGYTVRTTRGYARVIGARPDPDSRLIVDQADRLRALINPPLRPGFRRVPGQFDLSEDKARLDFTITDQEEGPNYPPAGCVKADASHTVSIEKYYTGLARGALAATYEVARDAPLGLAEDWFTRLVADRVIRGRNVPFKTLNGLAKQTSVIMKSVEYGDPEIYGKQTAAFRLEYEHMTSVVDLVRTSGIWRPVPNSDWARWSAALGNTAFNVRGNAKLAFALADEALIDLCEEATVPRNLLGSLPRTPPGTPPAGKLRNDTPDPYTSWLHYFCWLRLEVTDETIELKPLPPLPMDRLGNSPGSGSLPRITRGPGDPTRSLRSVPGDPGADVPFYTKAGYGGKAVEPVRSSPRPVGAAPGQPPPASGGPPAAVAGASIAQRRAPSSYHAVLEGFAVRAGHPVVPPTLVSVGGIPAVPANRADLGDGFGQGLAAVWLGCPVYFARWQLRFLLTSKPAGELPIPGNPFLGT